MLAVTILGNNSALSMHERHQTAQVVTCNEHLFLVDCGENTQTQIVRYKVKRNRINHIFISHLHGDHYYGLPGLLNTYSLTNRTEDLHLYATPELMEIIDLQLRVSASSFSYKLQFHPITSAGTLLELQDVSVDCFPVSHRIPCWGFVFKERTKPRKQQGEPLKSYAFCADTKYDESLLDHIRGTDLIYHESTYLDELQDKAVNRFHSTSTQAATMALKAGATKLLLGHFSSKYADTILFETEAKQVFLNTEASKEGVTYLVK